jgi:uncharacterized phage protein gp47/JayE
VTRALADGDNATGTVIVYVATASAGLDGASVAAIQAAVDEWATPLCTGATVTSATPQTINVAATLTPAQPDLEDAIASALTAYLATVPLGGTVARSAIFAAIHGAAPAVTSVTLTSPANDATLAANRFPVLGSVVLS